MNFHLRNKRHSYTRGKKVFILFVFFAIVLLGVNYATKGRLGTMVRTPLAAVWSTNGVVDDLVGSVHGVFMQNEALRNERDALRERIRELELYAINNMVLASENEELRGLLGNTASGTVNHGVVARVLSRGGTFPYGTVVLSYDTAAPYGRDALVFSEHNVVIGRVDIVGTNSATITLLSALGEETSVLVGTGERLVNAVVQGVGNGNMIAQLPRDARIEINDPVVLFGEETSIVGFVGDIETQATDAFQTLRIRTPHNLDTLQFVRVR